MLNTIFDSTINEIKFGYLKRHHPFRYCYLSSVYNNKPQLRTVVIRDMTDYNELIFFTDYRSPKIKQFQLNPNAEVLFYHPKKRWQIKVTGQIKLLDDKKLIELYQQKVQGQSTKDYTSKQSPSHVLKNPDQIEYGQKLHFAVLKLSPVAIESLQLKRPNHIRCRFKKDNNWEGEFLVP